MGGAVSAGRDNNELVEKLVRARYLRTPYVHRVYRAVDRADYFVAFERKRAYEDLAWKCGLLHLSSPCIYCDVMEGLKLKPGLSFLNLGSGTGYLSTMVGLILGTGGVNHGVELHGEVVEYAYERLNNFIQNSPAVDEFDFCEPKFVVGNCLCLTPEQQYDRVYCGAVCPPEYEGYMKNFIKVGGILIMPSGENLLCVKRRSETQWETKKLHCVSFSTLISPNEKGNKPVALPDIAPASLQVLCRTTIRNVLRNVIAQEQSSLVEYLMKSETTKKRRRNHVKTFCLSVDDSDSDELNRIHNLDSESGSNEVNALIRLVLSMRNHTRGLESFHREPASSDDSTDNSSSDDYSSSSDSDTTSSQSIVDDAKAAGSESKNDNENVSSNDLDLESSANTSNESNMTEEQNSQPNTSSNSNEMSSVASSSANVQSQNNPGDSGIIEDISKNPEEVSEDAGCSLEMETSSSDENEVNETATNWRRKRHITQDLNGSVRYSISDLDYSSDSDSERRTVTQSKIKKKNKNLKKDRKSPLPPHPYDINRKTLSNLLQKKIQKLPLPPLLKSYVNMNRKFVE